MQERYYWRGMWTDVNNFVLSCVTCSLRDDLRSLPDDLRSLRDDLRNHPLGCVGHSFAAIRAAAPTPSALEATLPAPPERMAEGSDSSEARQGRISPTGECEKPSPASRASPQALPTAPRPAVRTSAELRVWIRREATRQLGRKASPAALRVRMNAIRAEPLPEPPTHHPRGCRGGAKKRSRAAPLSDPVLHVSTPSVPKRAPAIPEPQHAAGAPAGKVRAVLRRVRALEKKNCALTAARASDEAARLRLHELTTASASAQDARLLVLEKATSSSDQDRHLPGAVNALKKVTFSSDQDARLRALDLPADVDGIYKELAVLKRNRERVWQRLDHLEACRLEIWKEVGDGRLRELGARLEQLEPLRVPIAWVDKAEAELSALVVKRDTVEEEGWSWEYGAEGRAPASKSDLHHLRLEMYGELLGIRRDLLGLRPRGNGVR